MRSYLLVSLALMRTSADTTRCAAERRGIEKCSAESATVDATSMLQITNFKKQLPTPAINATTCPLRTDAVWAAMDTYVEPGMISPFPGFGWSSQLQAAFWKLEAYWLVVNKTTPEELVAKYESPYGNQMNDTDYTGLWVKDGSCLFAFRGSDSQIDVDQLGKNAPEGYQTFGATRGAPNGVQWKTVEFHGLHVHEGVKVEFEALLAKMQSNNGLATIKEKCVNGLTLTGHSLGGGTSQMMATLLNKEGDPLGAELTVDHVFGFGPMPFAKGAPPANDKSPDGCFAGGMYANVNETEWQTTGKVKIDPIWQMLTATNLTSGETLEFRHVKTAHYLVISPDDILATPCGEDPPYPYTTGETEKGDFGLHMPNVYVEHIGCSPDEPF